MATKTLPSCRSAARPAVLLCGLAAATFHATAPAQDAAERVTVVAPKPAGDVTGFGDVPASSAPFQVNVTTQEQMRDDGVRRLSDLARIDPSVGGGYNAEGYYDFISVRGYVLDNRFNYRREGLPISAETTIPLDNKSRIEVLKGINGFQAGVGSPGGLVNAVVKRPTAQPVREAFVGWQQDGSVLASVDLGGRFGAQQEFGARLNVAAARIDPQVRDARGERWLAALAGEWRATADTLLEAEVEVSRRSQPSVPGFSVLGSVVPEPGDPNINLNDQPWSQPSVFGSTVGTLRWRQNLGDGWQFTAIGGTQRLTTDDRIAFPYGCVVAAQQQGLTEYFDRFCSNGTYDLYDFRSENEERRTNALDVSIAGAFATGPVRHTLSLGVQLARATVRTEPLAFNFTGVGNVQGTLVVPAAPEPTSPGSDRDSDSNDVYLRDAMAFGDDDTLWLGMRYTRQKTRTWQTDGTQRAGATQSFASPWVAYTHRFGTGLLAYASWGQGYESDIVPNTPIYSNAGQALDSLRSRQFEVGLKGRLEQGDWTVAAFDIDRPVSNDLCTGDVDPVCERVRDGSQRHRGVEALVDARFGDFSIAGGAMALQARREGSADASINGLRPTNVPAYTVRLQGGWRVPAVPGLELLALGSYESNRMVLPDNSLTVPGRGQVDLGLRYQQQAGATTLVWRAGVTNVFDERAWAQAPFQFGHSYLFPTPARSFAVSLQASL